MKTLKTLFFLLCLSTLYAQAPAEVEATDKISWLDIQSNTNITPQQREYIAKILFRTGQ
jgi:hypothetical protein